MNILDNNNDKLANINNGEIYGSIMSNHRMTTEEAVYLLGGIKNPVAGQDESDYLLNGKELWHDDISLISAEDARILDKIARHFKAMPEVWAADDWKKTIRISTDQAIKETYAAFQEAKYDGYVTDRDGANKWVDDWCKSGYGDGFDPDTRRETELRKALEGLGNLLYLKQENGEVIWPIEALKSFNEKELEICKRIVFPENKEARSATEQHKNGGQRR